MTFAGLRPTPAAASVPGATKRERAMDWTERRRRFRGLIAGDRCFHPASVFDPLSARIAEDLGRKQIEPEA